MELCCEKVSKSFGHVTALKDINLTVKSGEIRALLGGNGSGKSTLAKIIGGIYFSSGGKVVCGREDTTKTSPAKQKKRGVVITSQELSLFMNLSVAENLNITAIPVKGIFSDQRSVRKRAADILKTVRLEHLLEQKLSALAPNQLYMLEFAKALLQEPQILVVDEITSALFRDDVENVKEILHDLKKKGVIVLFISHRMNEIYNICDSVTVMRNGEIVGTYGIHDKDEKELLSLMVGKSEPDPVKSPEPESQQNKAESMLKLTDFQLPGFDTKINLDIMRGEIIGIAGLQGHGQSELTRAVMGLYGEAAITLAGQKTQITSPMAAVKKGLAFVSGDRIKEGSFLERSVFENAAAVSNIALNRKKIHLAQLLQKLGVKYDSSRQQIKELSGGNQQKVIIGRWVSSEPDIILADDPTKGIDVQARRDIHHIFCEMAEAGTTILMFSSDDEELISMSRMAKRARVIVMYEGTIAAELTGEAITVQNIINNSIQKRGTRD